MNDVQKGELEHLLAPFERAFQAGTVQHADEADVLDAVDKSISQYFDGKMEPRFVVA